MLYFVRRGLFCMSIGSYTSAQDLAYSKTQKALETFATREVNNRRIVLKIISDGKGNRYLEARELSLSNWKNYIDVWLHRKSYKLQSVVSFLAINTVSCDSSTSPLLKKSIEILDQKIHKYDSSRLHRLFHKTVSAAKEFRAAYSHLITDVDSRSDHTHSDRVVSKTAPVNEVTTQKNSSVDSDVGASERVQFLSVIDKDTSTEKTATTPVVSATTTLGDDSAITQVDQVIEQLLDIAFANTQELAPLEKILKEVELKNDPLLAQKCEIARAVFSQVYEQVKSKSQRRVPPPVDIQLYEIIPQKADGNCLLRSFAAGLEKAGKFPTELLEQYEGAQEAHPQFRAEAVLYLRRNYHNDPIIQTLLTEAISEHNDAENRRYTIEKQCLEAMKSMDGIDSSQVDRELFHLESAHQDRYITETPEQDAFEKYLKLSSQDRFFCTTAHLYALSKTFSVTVEVYLSQKNEGQVEFKKIDAIPDVENSQAKICLYFDPNGPHYDLILSKV